MSLEGMYMLNAAEYTEEKVHKALDILYTDRKNEYQYSILIVIILNVKSLKNYKITIVLQCNTMST